MNFDFSQTLICVVLLILPSVPKDTESIPFCAVIIVLLENVTGLTENNTKEKITQLTFNPLFNHFRIMSIFQSMNFVRDLTWRIGF